MNKPMNELPLMEDVNENIVLFHPHISNNAISNLQNTLSTRWIGQGPKVDLFESKFQKKFCNSNIPIAVGSGTDALHLSYILANIKSGDEVIAPLFTCTATNIPFLYMGVKIHFADIQPNTLNIDPTHVRKLMNEKIKAIVCVHYGGLPCDMDELKKIADEWGIPIIEDAAHALGATYHGQTIGSISDFTIFSFQAIKHITTGDGGMLSIKDYSKLELAKRLRWFGIDRSAKQNGIWENDIKEIGYKYQMNDISACLGITALDDFDYILNLRKMYFNIYEKELSNTPGLKFIGSGYTDREHACWLSTVIVENRESLYKKLRDYKIESAQVHYRNDRYSIFGGRGEYPNMDSIEDKYLVLPLHTKMTESDVYKVCNIINSGW